MMQAAGVLSIARRTLCLEAGRTDGGECEWIRWRFFSTGISIRKASKTREVCFDDGGLRWALQTLLCIDDGGLFTPTSL